MPWLDDIDLQDARRLDRSLREERTAAGVRRAALDALARMVPADAMRWGAAAPEPEPGYRVAITWAAPPEPTVTIGLRRRERPFSVRDRDLLGLLSPSIRRELGAARARALAADPPPGCAVVLLDGYGEIVRSSIDAERWLAEHFGPAEHPGWLPAPVAEWLALPPRPPLASVRDGRLLIVRLLPGDPHALLLEERVDAFRADALRRLGLTPREREVLEAAHSCADEAWIADELFLSSHAVRERLERIESKLRVRTGQEAVAEALRASA